MAESSELPYPPFDLANRVLRLRSNDLEGFVEYELIGRELAAAVTDRGMRRLT